LIKTEWTEGAIKDIEKLDKSIAQKILRKISWFSKNFQSVVPEPLSGQFKGTFKLRVGDWRVVYTMEERTITILFVGYRREIYKIK